MGYTSGDVVDVYTGNLRAIYGKHITYIKANMTGRVFDKVNDSMPLMLCWSITILEKGSDIPVYVAVYIHNNKIRFEEDTKLNFGLILNMVENSYSLLKIEWEKIVKGTILANILSPLDEASKVNQIQEILELAKKLGLIDK